MSAPKLWYYCDVSGQQQGPVDDKALVAEYNSGQLKDDCLIWCDSLPDWTPFAQVAEVYAQIQQPKVRSMATSAKVSAAAPRFGAGMPAKSNLVEEMAKKSIETLQQNNAKSSASPSVWTKVVGDDGYPYYTNNQTHETTWDRPEDYHSDEEHVPERNPKPQMKQLNTKQTAAKAAATSAPATAASSHDGDMAELKSALASLKADLEKTSGSIRDNIKANEKSQQDKTLVQDKLIAELKTELAACKSELKEAKSQIADYQKTLSTMQASVRAASDSVAELKTSSQNQVKLIKNFAKSLADNLKE